MDPLCQSGPRVDQTLLFQLNSTCFYSLIKSFKKIVIECLPCARHCSSDTIMERISKIFTNIYIWMGGNKSCKQWGPYKNVMISENGYPRAGWPNGEGWRTLPGWGSGKDSATWPSGRAIPGRGSSWCRSPEVGLRSVCVRSIKKARATGQGEYEQV